MKSAIIIQARKDSSRLDGKIFRKVQGTMLIEYLIKRMLLSGLPVVLAVPENTYEDVLFLKKEFDIEVFKGDEEDVLGRYYHAAQYFDTDTVVRVTGDNPLTSITCLHSILDIHHKMKNDLSHYLNIPWGAGVEVLSFRALSVSYHEARAQFDREHCTQYIYRKRDKFKVYQGIPPGIYNNKDIRLTIDTEEDLKRFKDILKHVPASKRGIVEVPDAIKYLISKKKAGSSSANPTKAQICA